MERLQELLSITAIILLVVRIQGIIKILRYMLWLNRTLIHILYQWWLSIHMTPRQISTNYQIKGPFQHETMIPFTIKNGKNGIKKKTAATACSPPDSTSSIFVASGLGIRSKRSSFSGDSILYPCPNIGCCPCSRASRRQFATAISFILHLPWYGLSPPPARYHPSQQQHHNKTQANLSNAHLASHRKCQHPPSP